MDVTQKIVEPGEGTRYWIVVGVGEDGTPFVALPAFGFAAEMEWRHYVHPSYLAGKAKGTLTWKDCEQVANALNGWHEPT